MLYVVTKANPRVSESSGNPSKPPGGSVVGTAGESQTSKQIREGGASANRAGVAVVGADEHTFQRE